MTVKLLLSRSVTTASSLNHGSRSGALVVVLAALLAPGSHSSHVHGRDHGPQAGQATTDVYRWGNYDANNGAGGVPEPVGHLTSIVQLAASNSSSYVLQCVGGASDCATDGVVWAFGYNFDGQLGDGTEGAAQSSPVQVAFPAGVHIVSIGEARDDGFAIDSTGQGWAWGLNTGALCVAARPHETTYPTPTEVVGMSDAVAVQGANDHALWLTKGGTLAQCSSSSPSLQPVPGLSDVSQITAGPWTFGAITQGDVYMWGSNNLGQLGVGSSAPSIATPTEVQLPAPAVQLYSGGDQTYNGHSLVLLQNSRVYAWGDGQEYQLGDHDTADEDSPVRVDVPSGVTFTAVAAGGDDSFAIDTRGDVWSWGGDGSATFHVVDHQVSAISATAGNVVDLHR